MKIWESAPQKYDRLSQRLNFRYLDEAYNRLIASIKSGDRVLDVGCGTGALSFRAAEKGARVKGMDVNRGMLEAARCLAEAKHLRGSVEFIERGVAELDSEKESGFDVVMSGLCFSELSGDELAFGLEQILRILRPGGLLLVADEVRPRSLHKKIWNGILRFFLKIYVYLRTGTTTHALKDFTERLERLGFQVVSCRLNAAENFVEVIAKKP